MTTISQNGGVIIYIREGVLKQWSTDQILWNNINSWPVTIQNSNTSLGYVKVYFTQVLTFSSDNEFFISGSSYIEFGSYSLNSNGTRAQIIIDGVANYPGLINNWDGTSGFSHIQVLNLEVLSINGSTLLASQGWLGQENFGRGDGITPVTENYIVNCYSNGTISNYSGGIVGSFAARYGGALFIRGCSSSGQIETAAGGITGSDAGSNAGNVVIKSCRSTGAITGDGAGGIVAELSHVVDLENCYSEGIISGNNAGGIAGANSGLTSCVIHNCYSQGQINGGNAGGICGSLAPGAGQTCTVSITNCYSIGDINNDPNNTGGICGFITNLSGGTNNVTINHCYTSGIVAAPNSGYIIGNPVNIENGSGTGYVITNSYSENFNGDNGWNDLNAKNTLTGTAYPPTTWVSTGINLPYELYNMGYTPYLITNITSVPCPLGCVGPRLIRTISRTVTVGRSTASAIKTSGISYGILFAQGPGPVNSISINSSTGAISTTLDTFPGIYTLYIYNTGSYNVTSFTLTVIVNTNNSNNSNPYTMTSLFTNNAQVFYKPHSLASGGIGTLKNYRHKARKI
jgi:hypothetical protein